MNIQSPKTRIVIIEDETFVRSALRRYLAARSELEIVADTEFGEKGIELVLTHLPDLVVLDLLLLTSQLTGMQTLAQITAMCPSTRVLVLSAYSEQGVVFDALRTGALGFVSKYDQPEEIIEAVLEVAAGHYHLTPLITQKMVEYLTDQAALPSGELEKILSRRERDVVECVSRGMTNREIAEQLFLSEKTVKTHVSNILHKLRLNRRQDVPLWMAHNERNRKLRP